MIQYFIILLDDTSVSFCHYANRRTTPKLIPIDTLRMAVLYAMKQNLNVQLVYPSYALPKEYDEVIDTIDHVCIKPATLAEDADVVVFDSINEASQFNAYKRDDTSYVIRTTHQSLFAEAGDIAALLPKLSRLNLVITDVDTFTDTDFNTYTDVLSMLSKTVEDIYVGGSTVQFNVLTDRMMLDQMNNCGAGETSVTLAPDGRFYICPAFYYDEDGSAVGDLSTGLNILNRQLYQLDHAPLCRRCDAYQCRRCIWLNHKITLEVNTPSHEQCVIAHIERNASKKLLDNIRRHGEFLPDKETIKKIDYLDPFDVRKEL